MVPFGLGHGRQRSRTAVFMAGRGVPAEGATDGGQPRRQPARPHAFAGATGAPGDTAAAAAATPDGSSSRVYQQIEEELARSRALKQELVRLGAVVSALEALALPDRSTLAAGQAHV
ncbi:hypothetical protein LPJ61_004144 [Coemansia biformis]|uniref:Uncharacterized protein n=1 Tax=Coemansia biformis TaxID=1286918 RepID=A0A9W7YBM2_9FUNG|nr:hypothetical protein LPJ61_004144 [Coemansia biformis]